MATIDCNVLQRKPSDLICSVNFLHIHNECICYTKPRSNVQLPFVPARNLYALFCLVNAPGSAVSRATCLSINILKVIPLKSLSTLHQLIWPSSGVKVAVLMETAVLLLSPACGPLYGLVLPILMGCSSSCVVCVMNMQYTST
jgi:hypothetical protein